MATLKQRQKAELKALNLECEARLQGKKGAERTAEMKVIEQLKREMQERHERELQEEEERKQAEAEAGAVNGDQDKEEEDATESTHPAESKEPKISRARQRALKKEAKEAEERKRRQEEAANKGPSKRDLEIASLTAILSKLNLKIRDIPPDGNCLFASIAHQLKVKQGPTLTIPELRSKAVRAMKDNPALFAPFLPEEESLESHCSKILKNGEWGSELELRALSIALGRQIWVHRLNSPTVKWGEDEGFDPETALHLTYHEHMFALGEHYNSAAPVNSED